MPEVHKYAKEMTEGVALWREQPPPKYLVHGLLTEGSLGLMCAYGSTFKSWLLQSLGIAVASGGPWLGAFGVSAKRVLHLDYEQGEYETRRRLRGLSQEPVAGLTVWDMPSIHLTDPNFIKELVKVVQVGGYGLVTIDSLAAGSIGNVSENDSRFAAPLRALKKAAARGGFSAMVLHHAKKTGPKPKDGEGEEDPRQLARGTGAIFDAADMMLTALRVNDSEVTVHHTKARTERATGMFHVKLEGDAPASVTLTAVTAAIREAQAFFKECSSILGVCAQLGPCSANDVLSRVKGQRDKNLKRVNRLVGYGVLRREEDKLVLGGSRDVILNLQKDTGRLKLLLGGKKWDG